MIVTKLNQPVYTLGLSREELQEIKIALLTRVHFLGDKYPTSLLDLPQKLLTILDKELP